MSDSTTPAPSSGGLTDMETILTRAVKKFFKWHLSGLTGTLIVASMLWFLVFFLFFLILVFVMCVEYRYEKEERRQADAEKALPKDEDKLWAEKRSNSRESSNTSIRKIVPIPMPPLPDDVPRRVIISDVPEMEPEIRQVESPTEVVTEESVIVDPPNEVVASPPPDPEPEPEPEDAPADAEEPQEESAEPEEVEANEEEVPEAPADPEPDEPEAVEPEPEETNEETPPEQPPDEEPEETADKEGDK